MLTGWAGGPLAEILLKDKSRPLWLSLLQELAEIFDLKVETVRSLLIEAVTHDWSSDPFSMGAYSYVAAGAIEASEKIAQPVSDTLYFVGEHTDTTGHWGTVHGAIRSGLRGAAQVLEHH
jgi:monoamine oxidase